MAEEHAPGGTKKPSKLLVIILLAVVLGGGGFFGFKIVSARGAVFKAPKVGSTVQLEEFLVNLADGKTFLKAGIALGIAEGMALGHGGGGQGKKEGEPPEVRDAIIMILTSKQPADLATTEGKEQLKHEIIKRLNEMFYRKSHGKKTEENPVSTDKPTEGPEQGTHSEEEPNRGPVLEVYFTSFATQRY